MRQGLSNLIPDAWPVFFHHRKLLPIQEQAIPYVLRGTNVLISSPTASGKTEAVLAPLYQRHVSFRRPMLSVVYIAPTKALVNDIYFRICDYMGGIGADSGVYRYTGDHHEFKKSENAFMLAVTPEAFDSLFLTQPEKLIGVKAVVLDEIHFLHGNARGQQLRHVINRLERYVNRQISGKDKFQIVATSATIDDIQSVKELWLGENALHVVHDKPREIEVTFVRRSDTKIIESVNEIAHQIREIVTLAQQRKVLVFANTRNDAHALAIALKEQFERTKWPVFLHIGILSASERDRVEKGMKDERLGICVATSTLEIGIDIGDIENVFIISAPNTVSSFLQRIGRGNRRSDISTATLFYRNEFEKAIYNIIIYLAKHGILDEVHEFDRPSVRFQQILSLVWNGVRKGHPITREDFRLIFPDSGWNEIVSDMIEMGHLREVDKRLILSDQLMDDGDQRTIHSVIGQSSANIHVIDTKTDDLIGHLNGLIGNGTVFLGEHIRQVDGLDGRYLFVDTPRQGSCGKAAKLPNTGKKSVLSRRILWQFALNSGQNPIQWKKDAERFVTWGGLTNNQIIAVFIKLNHGKVKIVVDDVAIKGIPDGLEPTPEILLSWMEDGGLYRIKYEQAKKFHEPSKYFNMLSYKLKEHEARMAIPTSNFCRWIKECIKGKLFCNIEN